MIGRRRQSIADDIRTLMLQPQGEPTALETGMASQKNSLAAPELGIHTGLTPIPSTAPFLRPRVLQGNFFPAEYPLAAKSHGAGMPLTAVVRQGFLAARAPKSLNRL